MEPSEKTNDKGARGDGKTDDTAAIQAAIDEVGGTKGTVLVPDGTYMVDAASESSLKLKSHITRRLSDRATLKAIPNAAKKYAVITISNAISGKPSRVEFKGSRFGDLKYFVCDITRAREVLGWIPKVAPEAGVEHLIDWIREKRHLFISGEVAS